MNIKNKISAILLLGLVGCGSVQKTKTPLAKEAPVKAILDLTKTANDRVPVTIDPAKITKEKLIYRLPKVVPGTYSVSDFGKYIDNLKAIDDKGGQLPVKKIDTNSWEISNANRLDKITYFVNDTFDQEKQGGIGKDTPFSPSGTNIEPTNYVLNLHGFVGYFESLKNNAYIIEIAAPSDFKTTSALPQTNILKSADGLKMTYSYFAPRYFDVTDNPMFYGNLDVEKFMVGDMEIVLAVYSPNKKYTAQQIKTGVEKMMKAQKAYLGTINSTKRYAIFLYLSDMSKEAPKGFGALEHHTSTVVVLPEIIPQEALEKAMKDVVSHEFFHIVSPLSVHSEDVHYFDYHQPTFSKHLWMYEGVTEYFANLFQINQGLINEEEFYHRIENKIQSAAAMDDDMSFTEMSEHILEAPYKDQYLNVYSKGALIGMCIDILIREATDGQKGILALMKELSKKYGKNKPFEDDAMVAEITAMTNPAVGDFLHKNVVQGVPIDYKDFFKKVGLLYGKTTFKTGYIRSGNSVLITFDEKADGIKFTDAVADNTFWNGAGALPNDIIRVVNGVTLDKININNVVNEMDGWEEGKEIEVILERGGKKVVIKTLTAQPFYSKGIKIDIDNKATEKQKSLRNAWLKK